MAKQKLKLTVFYQTTYDADTNQYETDDPKEMAQIDQSAIEHDPAFTLRYLFDSLPEGQLKFQVTAVPEIGDIELKEE